jgi:Helix-hairpin-helix containing domain
VIENRPAELQTVDGIGAKRRERIAHAWQEARQVREIMLFLHSHGVSTIRAVRIFKTYGEQAIEKVAEHPPSHSPFLLVVSPGCAPRLFSGVLTDLVGDVRHFVGDVGSCLFTARRCD